MIKYKEFFNEQYKMINNELFANAGVQFKSFIDNELNNMDQYDLDKYVENITTDIISNESLIRFKNDETGKSSYFFFKDVKNFDQDKELTSELEEALMGKEVGDRVETELLSGEIIKIKKRITPLLTKEFIEANNFVVAKDKLKDKGTLKKFTDKMCSAYLFLNLQILNFDFTKDNYKGLIEIIKYTLSVNGIITDDINFSTPEELINTIVELRKDSFSEEQLESLKSQTKMFVDGLKKSFLVTTFLISEYFAEKGEDTVSNISSDKLRFEYVTQIQEKLFNYFFINYIEPNIN